ncbi:MAG: hypothetical protein U0W24_02625 [Bacteroidales bacterium]
MENLLDHLFSSTWMMVTLFMVALIVTSFIAYGTNFFKNKYLNWLYKGFFIVLPFSPIIIGMFIPLNYGFSYFISEMKVINNRLCLLDKMEKGDDTSDWEEFRLHILNPETGTQISRKFYNDINKMGPDAGDTLLLYSYYNYILVNLKNNSLIRKIDKEYLQNRFPDLNSGIETMQYTENENNEHQGAGIAIVNKKAREYFYNPFSDKLSTDENKSILPGFNYQVDNNYIYHKGPDGKKELILSIENSKENYKIKRLRFGDPDHKSETGLYKKDFLEGEILQFFPNQRVVVVVSYETTDKLSFILDGISLDGNPLWTIAQEDLKLIDKYHDNPQLNSSTIYGNNLIFNSGGFIVSLQVYTGKINWVQRV